MLCYVMLCYVMSCHVMSCHVMSCYVMLCNVMFCYVTLRHVTSRHVTLCYAMLRYVTFRYVLFCSVLLCYIDFSFSFVCQVTRDTHLYLQDIEEREEGGTPAIVESIRAGMVFQLKEVRCEKNLSPCASLSINLLFFSLTASLSIAILYRTSHKPH